MSAASLVDYLSEKLYSLSLKMWGDTVQSSSTSFLMSGNKNFQPYDFSALLPEVNDKSDYQLAIHPSYQSQPLLRFASGIFGGLGQLKGLGKHNYFTEKEFSQSLFNFVSDSYCSKHVPFDSSLIPSTNKFLSLTRERLPSEFSVINQQTENMTKQKVSNPQVTEISVDISQLPPKEKSQSTKENCDISRSMKFNIELAHRKTKQMSKRSKRRRRRKKKSEQLNSNNSTSDDDEDDNNECVSSASDGMCISSKTPDFECSFSVSHSVQLSPCNSFIISVPSDSGDDSEWETFDEMELSAANNVDTSDIKCNDSSTFSSSPLKSESLKFNSFKPANCSFRVSSVISFIVPDGDSSDDSDWDTCESGTFPDNTDHEFSGLYFTNLCIPQSYYKKECKSDPIFEDACDEILQLRASLFKANNQWNNLDEGHKKPSKVTFASDEDLVKVYPVEVFERKGEWEVYATERLRFKRRIDELDKVISPCLKPEHRSKIFKKLFEPEL